MARNGDGLFRRDGIWYFKYRDSTGLYREKSTGVRKQPDARNYKLDFLEKLRQNAYSGELVHRFRWNWSNVGESDAGLRT